MNLRSVNAFELVNERSSVHRVEAVDEDQHEREGRREHELRQVVLQRVAQAGRARLRDVDGDDERLGGRGHGRLLEDASADRPSPDVDARGRRVGVYFAALIALTSSFDGLVGGLDLAVEELGHDVVIGAGADRRRLGVVLRHRAEERALRVGGLHVGDALLAAHVEGGVRTRPCGRAPSP